MLIVSKLDLDLVPRFEQRSEPGFSSAVLSAWDRVQPLCDPRELRHLLPVDPGDLFISGQSHRWFCDLSAANEPVVPREPEVDDVPLLDLPRAAPSSAGHLGRVTLWAAHEPTARSGRGQIGVRGRSSPGIVPTSGMPSMRMPATISAPQALRPANSAGPLLDRHQLDPTCVVLPLNPPTVPTEGCAATRLSPNAEILVPRPTA